MLRRYFLDTEFNEHSGTIQLISLALISADGREYYTVSNQWNPEDCNEWVTTHVLPSVWNRTLSAKDPETIRNEIVAFIGEDVPQFWGYYSAYDWVAFCWLFGAMVNLPKGWPRHCKDLKQLCDMVGNPSLPPKPAGHHALLDAQWNADVYQFLRQVAILEGFEPLDKEGGAA